MSDTTKPKNTVGGSKDFARKARELIAMMTLEEKVSQLMNATPGIPRLGIPPYDYWNEALHGVARSGVATVFPEPIGLAATFNPSLIEKMADAIATEGRAKYAIARRNGNYARFTGLTYWSPNVNIFRDPRWGRGMETYGEDPFLSGVMGTAFVRGLQGDDPNYLKAAATAKHFAVHSGPEATRHEADVHPSRHDLWETYLPAFRMLVRYGHVEAVMSAYNRLYGESCSASRLLLTDILRKEWGFKGHITSDDGAIADITSGHHLADSEAEGDAIALHAGANLECGNAYRHLGEAIEKGYIKESEIDEALFYPLVTRLKLGILLPDDDCPYNNVPESEICSDDHQRLAVETARESMVLLKNDGALPLDKNIHTLYVTGPGASDAFWMMGNYYGIGRHYTTYLQGIASKVSAGTALNFRPGVMESAPTTNAINYALDEAAMADAVIVVMGNCGNLEGEEGEAIDSVSSGDRLTLTLPDSQMDYLRDICGRKRGKVIVVLNGGGPIDMREISELADAVVMAWYPGQEGGQALADLIFGDADFSGRLPVTFPTDVDKLPSFDDYSMMGRTYKYMTDNIFYPFGYGLSYGRVVYRGATAVRKGDDVVVEVELKNEGEATVNETVQVYVSVPGAGSTAPLSQLVAFEREAVQSGESKRVRIDVPIDRFMTVQDDGSSVLLAGKYVVSVGGAAPSRRSEELGVSMAHAELTIWN